MVSFFFHSPFFPCFFLFGSLILTACSTCLIHLGKFKSKEFLRQYLQPFYKREWNHLYFSISLSKHIFQLAYASSSFFYLFALMRRETWVDACLIAGIIIAISLFFDYGVRLLASLWSQKILRTAFPLSLFYLAILYPVVELLWQLTFRCLRKLEISEQEQLDKTALKELIREHLDPIDQKLVASFLNFKERVAKEIMVPRVDIFSLDASTSIREASHLFATEGYSRIPIYRESLDQILGVVLYKDLLRCFVSPEPNLDASLESIAKPVLYAPENKKISQLLQEFRGKQIHMAIIVDEYGGTEGIVTIEDILEELVGEIEDEYDVGEAHQFWEIPSGGWVVDAKMTIHDIEEQLGIRIPSHGEYETIGGYVYHCAGTIPNKGWRLSHDDFELEVIASSERSLKKIKITPRAKHL